MRENKITQFVTSFIQEIEDSIEIATTGKEFIQRLKNASKEFEKEVNWGLYK